MKIHTSAIQPPASERRRWLALVVVCFGQLMIVLDSTIVNVALPSIQRDLHFSQADLTWVVNSYLITYGSLLLLAGRAGDLFGRKRVFLAGVAVFTMASVMSGFAYDPAVLVGARFLQGAGGALSESINWHWIFFINLPIGVATFVAGAALIDETAGAAVRQRVDVAGSVLVTAAMVLAVYAIVTAAQYGWASAHTLGFGGAAIALLATFLALEARIENPILPLRILRLRSLTGASAARALH